MGMLKKFFRVENSQLFSVIATSLATTVPRRCRLSAVIFILCTEIFYNEHKLRPAKYIKVAHSLMHRTGTGGAPHTAATSPTLLHA